jgi:hypothetical protein
LGKNPYNSKSVHNSIIEIIVANIVSQTIIIVSLNFIKAVSVAGNLRRKMIIVANNMRRKSG